VQQNVRNVLRVALFLAIGNFASFWYGDLVLGGSAANGKREGGRFFVGDHGRYTEVSEDVYRYSTLHYASVLVTHIIGLLAAATLSAQKDPFLVRRNKRRDCLLFGFMVGIMLVGTAAGGVYATLPFWLCPAIMLFGMCMDLRDAVRDAGENPPAMAAEQGIGPDGRAHG
jgi:hypothetical protein